LDWKKFCKRLQPIIARPFNECGGRTVDLNQYQQEAIDICHEASLTSSFSKTKGFFCFSFNKRSPKDALAWKTEFFLHMLFLENEAQINKSNYATMLFMSKQVSLPKISLILQKIQIAQKAIYALFARKPSILPTRTGLEKLNIYFDSTTVEFDVTCNCMDCGYCPKGAFSVYDWLFITHEMTWH